MVETKNAVGMFIGLFVVVLLGVILVDPLATVFKGNTARDTVVNESVDITALRGPDTSSLNVTLTTSLAESDPSGWKEEYTACLLGSTENTALVTVYNQSGVELTRDTDYLLTEAGLLSFYDTTNVNNTGAGSNTTSISYTYCQDDYLVEAWQRSVHNLTPGFFALAVLAASLLLVSWARKNEYM